MNDLQFETYKKLYKLEVMVLKSVTPGQVEIIKQIWDDLPVYMTFEFNSIFTKIRKTNDEREQRKILKGVYCL